MGMDPNVLSHQKELQQPPRTTRPGPAPVFGALSSIRALSIRTGLGNNQFLTGINPAHVIYHGIGCEDFFDTRHFVFWKKPGGNPDQRVPIFNHDSFRVLQK
jgi:hypothetical protein